MAKTTASARVQKLNQRDSAFEKSTGKSAFSPELRARKTDIALMVDQGKNEDQILATIGGSISREELKKFLAANNLVIKQLYGRKK